MIFENFGAGSRSSIPYLRIGTVPLRWQASRIPKLAAPDAVEFLFISASLLDQFSGFSP
jgi:hypothetical protein